MYFAVIKCKTKDVIGLLVINISTNNNISTKVIGLFQDCEIATVTDHISSFMVLCRFHMNRQQMLCYTRKV